MMDSELMNGSGIKKIFDKIRTALNSSNFYEAHQLYRSVYFRVRKDLTLAKYLFDGSMLLISKGQYASGIDIGNLMLTTLMSCLRSGDEEWVHKVCNLIKLVKPTVLEREPFIKLFLKWNQCHADDLKLKAHRYLAEMYLSERNYQAVRYHYLLSGDGELCAKFLIELQSTLGFDAEIDVFIVQTVLQYLCLKNSRAAINVFCCYTVEHPKIRKNRPPYTFPLLNFIWFLFKAIELRKLRIFMIICEQYELTIKRDPCFIEYLEQIAQLFFGVKPHQIAFGNQTTQRPTATSTSTSTTTADLFTDIFQSLLSEFGLNPRRSTTSASSSTATGSSANNNNSSANFSVPDID